MKNQTHRSSQTQWSF